MHLLSAIDHIDHISLKSCFFILYIYPIYESDVEIFSCNTGGPRIILVVRFELLPTQVLSAPYNKGFLNFIRWFQYFMLCAIHVMSS